MSNLTHLLRALSKPLAPAPASRPSEARPERLRLTLGQLAAQVANEPERPTTSRFTAPGVRAQDWQIQRDPHRIFGRTRPPVERSDDFRRVVALPRRAPLDLTSPEAKVFATEVTARFSNGATTCTCRADLQRPCIKHLNPVQAWALDEIANVGGILAPIATGAGKTTINILAPMAVPGCKLAVLLVPPNLQEQLGREYDAVSRHFRVPNLNLFGSIRGKLIIGRPVLHVVPYSRFSRADATTLLEQLQPDLVVADEAHKLRNPGTATTSRVLRYFAQHIETRACFWSGTLTTRSLRDYGHLSAIALKENSPLPLEPNVVEEWALALDAVADNSPPGVLYELCRPGEHVRDGFRRRLHDTPGVVATRESSVDVSLVITERKAPAIPPAVSKALSEVRKTNIRPDGEELVERMQVVECARQLALGFYYHWRFPRGEPEALIYEWFDARKSWARELRQKLERRGEHLDSPLLCRNAAERAWAETPYEGELPVWKAETWPAWRDIKDRVAHYTEAVWVDDYLARDAAEWAKKNKGIVWFQDIAFGRKVAELAGLPCYDGHAGSPRLVEQVNGKHLWREDGKRSVVLSVRQYATGTDGLQHRFHKQLVASPPSSGDTWEQMLGRLARIGQEEYEVLCEVYRHTEEMANAIDKAAREAKYVEETMGSYQKLRNADVAFPLDT